MRQPMFLAAMVLILPIGSKATCGQAVAFEPIPAAFPSGVNLVATPVVSLDRRYVRLGLNPTFTALQGFTTLSVPAAVSGGGANGLGGLGGGVAGFAGLNGPMNPAAGMPSFVPPTDFGEAAPPPAAFGFSSDPFEAALRAQDRPAPAPPQAPPKRRVVRRRPTRTAKPPVAAKRP